MTWRGGGGGMWLFTVCSVQNFHLSHCYRRPQSTPGDNARLACAARGAEYVLCNAGNPGYCSPSVSVLANRCYCKRNRWSVINRLQAVDDRLWQKTEFHNPIWYCMENKSENHLFIAVLSTIVGRSQRHTWLVITDVLGHGGLWLHISYAVCRPLYKKLSYCWETVRCDSMPRIAEMDMKMTT